MKDKYFATSNFQLSVILCCLGFRVASLDRSNPQRVQFCIERGHGLEGAIKSIYAGEIKLDPQIVFMHQKLLKNRLYSEK